MELGNKTIPSNFFDLNLIEMSLPLKTISFKMTALVFEIKIKYRSQKYRFLCKLCQSRYIHIQNIHIYI